MTLVGIDGFVTFDRKAKMVGSGNIYQNLNRGTVKINANGFSINSAVSRIGLTNEYEDYMNDSNANIIKKLTGEN